MPYLFGGIALDTDLEFQQLEDLGRRVPRLRLGLRSVSSYHGDETILHQSDGRYRLTTGFVGQDSERDWVFRSCFPDSFTFSPSHRRIDCHIASADRQVWQDVLFRRIIPRVATTYGAMAIHAAAIAIDGRCLLLLGPSGAGKSTLTAFCAQAGWRVLSDDITLAWNDERVMIEPVQRGMGVWDRVCSALALPPGQCDPMPGYDGRKYSFQPAQEPSSAAHSLSAVLVLDRSSQVVEPVLTRMQPDDALRALVPQNIPFVVETQPSAATAASFGRIAALSRRIPFYRLAYPDGYDALPNTEAALRHTPIGETIA